MNFSSEWVFALFGAGGSGREIMAFAMENVSELRGGDSEGHVCFVETSPRSNQVNGVPCLSEVEYLNLRCEKKTFNISVADSAARQRVAERWLDNGIEAFSLRSKSAECLGPSEIGTGSILCGHTSVLPNVRIGKFFHANYYSYVSHDSIIGDYVTFAPNVHCNGNVQIGNHVFIGAGATIKQGSLDKKLVIGEGAVIGMGAVVTRDVPPHVTVVGNPARVVK